MAELVHSAWKVIPQFNSTSIKETVKFYTEELSFTLGGVHPDDNPDIEPTFCSIFVGPKADANIYFFECKKEDFHASAAMIALGTDELDEFYRLLTAKGKVFIKEPIEDKERASNSCWAQSGLLHQSLLRIVTQFQLLCPLMFEKDQTSLLLVAEKGLREIEGMEERSHRRSLG
ncbi:predicted protein [Uncinocarpus reesii 1704]|uniref:Glyoxalase/fosfomycin resistance/dioxygenase domain-containing protein n=1 Tax=Uncinocarpus reesii (strain UAMH 1704) TaxID=336963 RepID=C4JZJ3_UNCRE|nr:uncharacterized protein UREG_07594 [Uncinocarpus reesii 1704]EEP82729.1 predicted protein [Uncinocarpus reesii 1704]